MTALQICGMVNDPPTQIKQKQYEIPDDLPDDLATIDVDAFAKLSDDTATPLASPTPTALTPVTPLAASAVTPVTPLAASVTPAPCITDISEVSVGEEIIRTCVTPCKVKEVEVMLKVEKQRHLCALKLLQYFFSKEELSMSNTEGTHGKQSLDKNKLNSLKALLFAKFPVESSEEKLLLSLVVKI